MTIELSDSENELLEARASRAGKSVAQVATDLISQRLRLDAINEICAEPRAALAASGLTEDEFIEEYLREEHAARGVPYDDA